MQQSGNLRARPHADKLPTCIKELGSKGNHLWKLQKADTNVTERRGQVPASVSSRIVSFSHSHNAGFRVKYTRKELRISPQLRKASEARDMSGVSLNEVPERLLYEAVKVRPRLCQSPPGVGVTRHGVLPKRAANKEWNQTRREKCVAVLNAERS